MNREPTKRYPLRNCIRPDTYRYCLDQGCFAQLWQRLQEEFGRAHQFGELDLYEINGVSFLLRASYATGSITVIKKKDLAEEDLDLFHQIVGFEEHVELGLVS